MTNRSNTTRSSPRRKRNVHGEQKNNSPNNDDIVVHRISKEKGIETCKIAANHFQKMHNQEEWLIAPIIDCYLELLVL